MSFLVGLKKLLDDCFGTLENLPESSVPMDAWEGAMFPPGYEGFVPKGAAPDEPGMSGAYRLPSNSSIAVALGVFTEEGKRYEWIQFHGEHHPWLFRRVVAHPA